MRVTIEIRDDNDTVVQQPTPSEPQDASLVFAGPAPCHLGGTPGEPVVPPHPIRPPEPPGTDVADTAGEYIPAGPAPEI